MGKTALVPAVLAGAGMLLLAQSGYDGPRPAKPDVPYLVHASNLIETEALEAAEQDKGNKFYAAVSGASSPVRTPLPEPIFLIEADQLKPDSLQMFRMRTNRDRRELELPKDPRDAKDDERPVHMTMERVDGNLYRVEVGEILENGEYCLSPSGSSRVFCFQVY